MTRWLVVLCLLLPALAEAQNVVTGPTLSATGATFTVTWASGARVAWAGGYNDGTSFQTGTQTPPLLFTLPYHAAAPTGAWVCVGGMCNPLVVPAKQTAQTTVNVSYLEPTTSNCAGQPSPPCSTALTDLAFVRLYVRVDGGSETVFNFPASRPTGGTVVSRRVTIPVDRGTLALTVSALDTEGLESIRSPSVTFVIQAGVPGQGAKPVVQFRYE
jgi:hypothetical protein